MNEPLFSADTTTLRPRREYLILMLVVSVVLHMAASLFLLLSPRGNSDGRTIAFVDLAMSTDTPSAALPVPPPPQPVPAESPIPPGKPAPEAPEPETTTQAVTPQVPPVTEPASGTSISMGIGRGYFGSLGEGDSLKDEVREYYFTMVSRINEQWWQRPEADDTRVGMVIVMVTVARDGTVVNAQLMKSSGKKEYDEAVLAAARAASPLPALPENYDGDFFQAPLRVMPPLSLMRIGEGVKGVLLR